MQSAAAVAAAMLPATARAESLPEAVKRLSLENTPNVDEYWATNPPKLLPGPAAMTTPSAMSVQLTVPSLDSGVEYLWFKRYEANAGSRAANIISQFKVVPGAAGFLVSLSPGNYIACAYSSQHGLYEGKPFTVGANPSAKR